MDRIRQKLEKTSFQVKKWGSKKLPSVCFWIFVSILLCAFILGIWQRESIQKFFLFFIPEPFVSEPKRNFASYFAKDVTKDFITTPLEADDVLIFESQGSLWITDKYGSKRELLSACNHCTSCSFVSLDWSPDGEKIAFRTGNNLFIYDGIKEKVYKVYEETRPDFWLQEEWSLNGRYYAYFKIFEDKEGVIYIFDTEMQRVSEINMLDNEYKSANSLAWDVFNNLYIISRNYPYITSSGANESINGVSRNESVDSIIKIDIKTREAKKIVTMERTTNTVSQFIGRIVVDSRSNNLFYYYSIGPFGESVYYKMNLEILMPQEISYAFPRGYPLISPDETKFLVVNSGPDSREMFLMHFNDFERDTPLTIDDMRLRTDFFVSTSGSDDIWWDNNRIVAEKDSFGDLYLLNIETLETEKFPLEVSTHYVYIRPTFTPKQ